MVLRFMERAAAEIKEEQSNTEVNAEGDKVPKGRWGADGDHVHDSE